MRPRVALAASALALAALGAGVASVAAAEISFADPEGKATFGEGIEFTAELRTDVVIDRLELRLRFPDTLGPVIRPIELTAGETTRVTGGWDLARDGHLVPNTTVTGEWVAWPVDDGEPVTSAPVTVRYEDTRFEWRRVTGDVVRVYWTQGGNAFGQRALAIGEEAVRETAELLGVDERERIDFFVYHDEEPFRQALGPGTRENVGGQAHADIRTLFALITQSEIDDPWVRIVVPHELVHIVFDTTVDNPYRFPPRWLNEGLAVYLSQGYDPSDRGQVERAARDGDLIPLTGLSGQFPTGLDGFSLAYAESVSAVHYLVETHDRDALVSLVRSYREGLTDDEAFTRAIGMDLEAFQAAWFTHLGAEARPPVGPQPAAPGPVPSAWLAPAATAAPLPTRPSSAATIPPAAATVRPTATSPGTAASGSDGVPAAGIALGVLVVGGVLAGGLFLARRPRGGR